MPEEDINALALLHMTPLLRRDLLLVADEQIPECGGLEEARIRCSTEAVNLCLQITSPALGLGLAIEGLRPRLHPPATHLRLPTSPELPDRRHCNLRWFTGDRVGRRHSGAKDSIGFSRTPS
jgi:hypothetical protein